MAEEALDFVGMAHSKLFLIPAAVTPCLMVALTAPQLRAPGGISRQRRPYRFPPGLVSLLRPPNRGTEDPEAYNLFLKAQYYGPKGTLYYKQAIEYLEQAIEKDPKFELAYAGIANGYYTLGSVGRIGSAEAYTKAKAAALKALEIDSNAERLWDSARNRMMTIVGAH
jgi:tetratricopeptide (TPR) repeat protein